MEAKSIARLELIQVAEAVSREKSIEKEEVIVAMEEAIQKAARSKYGLERDIRANIDRKNGSINIAQFTEVVDTVENDITQMSFKESERRNLGIEIGQFYKQPLPPIDFGRIAAQTAKQVIAQKVREAERQRQYLEYKDRVGEIVVGTIKRVDNHSISIDRGRAEAVIKKDHMIPREQLRPGDRLRCFIIDVSEELKGPQIFLSRASNEFLAALFTQEVPEIYDGIIEVKGVAREPGSRAKISAFSNDPTIDPVGACVGMRGSRVQAVTNELAGERVDIIMWDEDPARFAINALAPAEALSIVVDEEAHSMDIAVDDEQLSQAIGRGGQNVRLASQLSGWDLNIMSASDADQKAETEISALIEIFMKQLDVDEDVALILAQEGFSGLEEIAYVPEQEMLDIEEFDADIVAELRSRARDVLLTKAIANEEQLEMAEPAQDLLDMEGVTEELAKILASKGIATMDELAEQSVDELTEIDSIDEEQAATLIMKARESWFTDEQTEAGE